MVFKVDKINVADLLKNLNKVFKNSFEINELQYKFKDKLLLDNIKIFLANFLKYCIGAH